MKKNQREKGQTVIETALMIMFLLVLFFGIAEIARAWWLKNQLNNAARVAVRVAIVTPSLAPVGPSTCTSANVIVKAACDSITNTALHNDPATTVSLTTPNNPAVTGDEIRVNVQGTFRSVVPNLASLSFGLFRGVVPMQSSSSMRYE